MLPVATVFAEAIRPHLADKPVPRCLPEKKDRDHRPGHKGRGLLLYPGEHKGKNKSPLRRMHFIRKCHPSVFTVVGMVVNCRQKRTGKKCNYCVYFFPGSHFWILFFYYSSRHFQHNNNHIIHIIIVSCDQKLTFACWRVISLSKNR